MWRASSESLGEKQVMQVNERAKRGAWATDLHADTGRWIEHPRRNSHEQAALHLNVHDYTACTVLNALNAKTATAKRMPTIMDNDIMPDMGRMTPSLHSAGKITFLWAQTTVADRQLLPTR